MHLGSKTKIVCTIGPASDSSETLEQMVQAGMNIARLNFSHGDFGGHKATIERIRAAATAVGEQVAIMADLPGPKMRIGELEEEPIWLRAGEHFTLTTEELVGNQDRASVSFERLPDVVQAGDRLFLNDGIIYLVVERTEGREVHCKVRVGGELRSRKGLNLPGIDLGMSAFTAHDRACVEFAAEQGIDAVSQSFVATAEDVEAVRRHADSLGYRPFVIAKIERSNALEQLDSILEAADGIMVARGDLGVEIPIERMAVTQKDIVDKANLLGRPVITATQLLHSMVNQQRPTRAEATDVANAILDGTDCIMLSEESAMGKHPVESVGMLARIATATEPHLLPHRVWEVLEDASYRETNTAVVDLITLSVELTLERASAEAVIVPTLSGATARNLARFRLPVWITAFSPEPATCQTLQFSYGVNPVQVPEDLADWSAFSREWLKTQGITEGLALLVQGPSQHNPAANHRMEIVELGGGEFS